MKICIIYGHHNTKSSFNAAIRDTFIEEATLCGHEIDLINLFDEEEQLPFYNSEMNPPPHLVLEYRKRLENSDVMFLIGSCHNLRMPSILENWVDWVLHPKWFFRYRALVPGSKYVKNYGYPVPGAMNGKAVFNLGGMVTKYIRFYSVLPGMEKEEFDKHMKRVRKLARSLNPNKKKKISWWA